MPFLLVRPEAWTATQRIENFPLRKCGIGHFHLTKNDLKRRAKIKYFTELVKTDLFRLFQPQDSHCPRSGCCSTLHHFSQLTKSPLLIVLMYFTQFSAYIQIAQN